MELHQAQRFENVTLNEAQLVIDQFGRVHFRRGEDQAIEDSVSKLHLITRGNGSVEWEGRRFPLLAGRLYLLPPRPMRFRNPAGHGKLYIRFTLRLHGIELLRGMPPLSVPAPAGLRGHWAVAFRASEVMAVKAACYLALTRFLAPLKRHVLGQASHYAYYTPFWRAIEADPGAPDILARALAPFGVTAKHFAERYQVQWGETPRAFLEGRRMALARTLLDEPSLSIDALSERLGFVDRSHFSRTFRKHTGCSPASYRRRFRLATDP